jgi:hypothetical protein
MTHSIDPIEIEFIEDLKLREFRILPSDMEFIRNNSRSMIFILRITLYYIDFLRSLNLSDPGIYDTAETIGMKLQACGVWDRFNSNLKYMMIEGSNVSFEMYSMLRIFMPINYNSLKKSYTSGSHEMKYSERNLISLYHEIYTEENFYPEPPPSRP